MTIIVDRATRELVGAAMACPDASAAIHECVLAIRARVTVEVLADTIHALPVDVADPQRALRRRAPRAGQAGQRRPGLADWGVAVADGRPGEGAQAPERAGRSR